jgi:choline kinase
MAAGMGNRFGGLKQITPMGPSGEFILDYSVYDAIKAGFDKVIFIIKKENLELFKEVVSNHLEKRIKVEYAFQDLNDIPVQVDIPESRVKPWGTTHALYSARNMIDDNFAILNADDFYGRDAFMQIANFLRTSNDDSNACMVGYKLKNTLSKMGTVARGICQVEDGCLKHIDERLKIQREDGIIKYFDNEKSYPLDEESIASMNMWGFSKSIINYIEDDVKAFFEQNRNDLEKVECLLPVTVSHFIDKKVIDVNVLKTNSTWMGVTYREDAGKVQEAIKELIEKGEYPEQLWK